MLYLTFIERLCSVKAEHGLWTKKTKFYPCDIIENLEMIYNPKKFQWGRMYDHIHYESE